MQTELKLVVCDDSDKAMQLMNNKSSLKHIIVIEKLSQEALDRASSLSINIMSLEKAKELGASNLKKPVPPKPDDLATICYTSGTTGTPKGAMITHKNMISIASSMLFYIKSSGLVKEGDERYLSYLPLAHMFERISQAVVVCLGGRIAFYQGDIKKLVDDMKEVGRFDFEDLFVNQ
jgi:long-chain acyl-CoA synthetase